MTSSWTIQLLLKLDLDVWHEMNLIQRQIKREPVE